jgi:flagellar assembly protein FliH
LRMQNSQALHLEAARKAEEMEYLRGFEEGQASALRGVEADHEALERLMRSLREQMELLFVRMQSEAFQFALAVAGKIVKREVFIDNEVVIRQIREAVSRIVGVESIKLRIHPEDELFVRERKGILLSSAESIREVLIEVDDKMERGDCIIESAAGNVDARRSTQLAQIEAALFGEAREGTEGTG